MNEPQAWIIGWKVTGVFCRIAVHNTVFSAKILPLYARNGPEIELLCLQQFIADAFQHRFAVLRRWLFTEQTSSVGAYLCKHKRQQECLSVEGRPPASVYLVKLA